jgi:hypothetical protein
MGEAFIVRRGGGAAVETVEYMQATGGVTNEYDLDGTRWKSHTFETTSTFTITAVSNVDLTRNKLHFLCVGGGGGAGNASGGGGAGGFRSSREVSGTNTTPESMVNISFTQSFTVEVGSGGGSQAKGGNSSFLNILSYGGGGSVNSQRIRHVTTDGGSGAGAGSEYQTTGISIPAGEGLIRQGNRGGNGWGSTTNDNTRGRGGGGGALTAGVPAGTAFGSTDLGVGGNGAPSSLRNGTSEFFAAGGSGQNNNTAAATTNNGNGTRGSGGNFNTTGQAGIVILAYEIAPTII